MSPRKFLIRTAFALLLVSECALANTWYVDASAAPPGNGTLGSPYASIQYAHDQATTVDFDLLLVAPGTYFENLTLTKRITVRSTGGAESTTLRPLAAGTILRLQGPVDALTSPVFEGFRITGAFGPSDTAAVKSFDGMLYRCIVSGMLGAGQVAFSTEYNGYILDCTIAGNDVGIVQSNIGFTFLVNSILWNRVSDFDPSVGGSNISYCAMGTSVQGMGGIGNFRGDPGLCYAWTGDMHLVAGSPCINAGNPALPNDPDGSRSDIGYHPYDPMYACGPFTRLCPGDGSAAPCPCANSGIPGRGCDNSHSGGGALLFATGATNPDTVVLHVSGELPTALTIFLGGNATLAPGVPYGDGLRCAGGSLKRLYVKTAVGGEANAPTGGDPSISDRSAALGNPIIPGGRRYYQTYYRDGNPSFCPSPQGSTFNASSGVKVAW